MNRETYEALDALLKSKRIEDEAEDILLEMAECLADMGKLHTPVTHKERFGKVQVEALGTCEPSEEDPDEISVYIQTLTVDGREFSIEEYML